MSTLGPASGDDRQVAGFLFDSSVRATAIVMGFMFSKAAVVFALWSRDQAPVSALLVSLDLVMVLIGLLVSISFTHKELELPYYRYYLLLDYGAMLLLYAAVECIHGGSPGDPVFENGLKSMVLALAILLVRGLLGLPAKSPVRPITPWEYVRSFAPFHLGGISLALCAFWDPAHTLRWALMGVGVLILFFLFQWVWQADIKIQLRRRKRY